MNVKRTFGVVAALAMTAAAFGSAAQATTVPGDSPLAAFGEDPSAADPALVEKALGPVEPSPADSWDIILAAIARADQDLDQAIIDKALECWGAQSCDTGTGGELVMGYADGGGDTVNVWRSVSHMEAILQALTYPEIGAVSTSSSDIPTSVSPSPRRSQRPRPRESRTCRSRRATSGCPAKRVRSFPVRTTRP
jgi:hypothetical protein